MCSTNVIKYTKRLSPSAHDKRWEEDPKKKQWHALHIQSAYGTPGKIHAAAMWKLQKDCIKKQTNWDFGIIVKTDDLRMWGLIRLCSPAIQGLVGCSNEALPVPLQFSFHIKYNKHVPVHQVNVSIKIIRTKMPTTLYEEQIVWNSIRNWQDMQTLLFVSVTVWRAHCMKFHRKCVRYANLAVRFSHGMDSNMSEIPQELCEICKQCCVFQSPYGQ